MTDLQLLAEIKKAKNEFGHIMELEILEDDILNHCPISNYLNFILGFGYGCIDGDDTAILTPRAGNYPYSLFLRSDIESFIILLRETMEYYDELALTDNDIKYSELKSIIEHHKKYLEQKGKKKEKKVIEDDLYLILDTVDNAVKIGRSKNPTARLSQLQLATNHKLKLLQSIKSKGFMEKSLHKRFASIRLASEWFKNDGTIIKYFEEELL